MVKVEFFLERGLLVKDITIEKVTASLPIGFVLSLEQVIQDFIYSLVEDVPQVDNFYRAKIHFNTGKLVIKEIICCTAYSC